MIGLVPDGFILVHVLDLAFHGYLDGFILVHVLDLAFHGYLDGFFLSMCLDLIFAMAKALSNS